MTDYIPLSRKYTDLQHRHRSISSSSLNLGRLFAQPNKIFSPAPRIAGESVLVMLNPGVSARRQHGPRPYPGLSSSTGLVIRPKPSKNGSLPLPPPPPPLPPILSFPGHVQYNANPVLQILCELPVSCDVCTVLTKPSANGKAKDEKYDLRMFSLKRWRDLYTRESQMRFLASINTIGRDHFSAHQTPRVLHNETDAKEAYIAMLSPIIPIVNDLIAIPHQKHFEVQIFSELRNPGGSQDRIDHALVLVNRSKTHNDLRDLAVFLPLLIIEAKRHDLINPNDWKDIKQAKTRRLNPKKEHNLSTILPQGLMYAREREVARIYFTDYADTVATNIGFAELKDPDTSIPLSYTVVRNSPHGTSDLFSFGPRLAITFDLYMALHEIGLLDSSAFPRDQHPLSEHLDRYLRPHAYEEPLVVSESESESDPESQEVVRGRSRSRSPGRPSAGRGTRNSSNASMGFERGTILR